MRGRLKVWMQRKRVGLARRLVRGTGMKIVNEWIFNDTERRLRHYRFLEKLAKARQMRKQNHKPEEARHAV